MKILAADGISPEGIALLGDYEVDVRDKISHEELAEIIGGYDALMVRSASKVSADIIARADRLKIIGRAGVGVDNIDVKAATERGIIVINSPGGNTIAATEHTMAMMLSLTRNIPAADATMHAGEWNRKAYVGVELRGKTLGIIGMGRIGSGVAKRALAFDMNIIAYDPYINEERAKALGVTVGTLEDIFREADFITVHMPLTKETRGMISMEQMRQMKRGVRLVNCARGGIIDEADLATAVKEGIVAGAAIDVFETEPLVADSPLRDVPGIVLTPHLGASTVEAQIGVSVDVAEGIRAALRGEPVTAAVNMAPVSQEVMRVIRPYITLAERLGCTVCSLAEGAVSQVEVIYSGEITEVNTSFLTTAVLKGMLNPILESEINYVNAPGVAKSRGIKVVEVKEKETAHFSTLITVRVTAAGGTAEVQGTLFGTEGRIVRINRFRVDVDPHARILICPHINRPGIIGSIGSIMGAAGVNISGMQVGKSDRAGTNIMVLTIDHDIPDETFARVLAVDGIFDAKLVNFETV
ncbi:phosphoglycerate dehydrogenase [uncultured Selenomonas sp.]|uniref:phosphoglycerate dehydrogenase n=1 Tax=uncultured Selenomonas sp. TaxID=159275 RepID=UPI0028D79F24|nr:phosphoglycerate dehydrogenase [uncultured Selenomonas sp.]